MDDDSEEVGSSCPSVWLQTECTKGADVVGRTFIDPVVTTCATQLRSLCVTAQSQKRDMKIKNEN
jgi:hypothetical protein